LVRRQRARRRVVVLGDEGREVRVRERVRRAAGRVRPAGDQRHRPRAGSDRSLPRRVEPGGVPRPCRRVRVARRGRGAAPAGVGLLPLSTVDGARLRGRGRGAVRDPDGRFALGPGGALPPVRARGEVRRERGGGDLRLEAGVRDGRAVPPGAAAELGSSAVGPRKERTVRRQQVNPTSWQEKFGFSQGWRVDDPSTLLFVSGQVAVDEQGQLVAAGDLEGQARATFENVGRVLEQAGMTFANVVQLSVYLTDIADLRTFARVRDEFVDTAEPPASTAVGVTGLAMPGMMIEVNAIAVA